MMYKVRLLPEAEDDLLQIYRYIARRSSHTVAQGYVDRIQTYLNGFTQFPERGTVRDELRNGIRIVGFERRVTIAFKVQRDEVMIFGILYAGRQLSRDE
ncbi:type II toxin-antitoxin system RelE/ParE family toxin [Rhizobium sp. LjRoot254]|uniref:type II toxin-antitoxin system RelE/ParE family toxin n=1 Tax=Rhizobium sp. LjRoot254 TaxID=3342297 RepID=UPI003ECD24A1